MFISIITDMHVDNQIRDGHITIIVKKKKKGEILINWRPYISVPKVTLKMNTPKLFSPRKRTIHIETIIWSYPKF